MSIILTHHRESDFLIPDLVPPEKPESASGDLAASSIFKRLKSYLYRDASCRPPQRISGIIYRRGS